MRKPQFTEAQKLAQAHRCSKCWNQDSNRSQQSPQLMSHGHLPQDSVKIHRSWSVFDWNSGPLQGLFPETLVLQYSCWTDGCEWIFSLALNLITPLLAAPLCPQHWRSIAFRPDWRLFIWATKEARTFIASKESRHPKLSLLDHGGGLITFFFFPLPTLKNSSLKPRAWEEKWKEWFD